MADRLVINQLEFRHPWHEGAIKWLKSFYENRLNEFIKQCNKTYDIFKKRVFRETDEQEINDAKHIFDVSIDFVYKRYSHLSDYYEVQKIIKGTHKRHEFCDCSKPVCICLDEWHPFIILYYGKELEYIWGYFTKTYSDWLKFIYNDIRRKFQKHFNNVMKWAKENEE